jgi:hypothetical protein
MTLTMADSVTVPDLPTGMDAYAGYIDGPHANFPQLVARFPSALHLSISTQQAFDPAADCLDIETYDAVPADAPGFIEARAGLRVLYTSRDNVAALMPALANIPRTAYKLWTAHYGAGQHICGPSSCGLEWQADGTQWESLTPYDQSLLAANFFAIPVEGPMFINSQGKTWMFVANGLASFWREVPVAPTQYPVEPDPNGTWFGLWDHEEIGQLVSP